MVTPLEKSVRSFLLYHCTLGVNTNHVIKNMDSWFLVWCLYKSKIVFDLVFI